MSPRGAALPEGPAEAGRLSAQVQEAGYRAQGPSGCKGPTSPPGSAALPGPLSAGRGSPQTPDVLSVLCALRGGLPEGAPCPTAGALSRPRRRPGAFSSLRLLVQQVGRGWQGHLQDTESLQLTILWQLLLASPAETALLVQETLCWTGP